MKKSFFLALLLAPAMAGAQPTAFTFDHGDLPAKCEWGSTRVTSTKGDSVKTGQDDSRPSGKVCLTGDAERGGVFIQNEDQSAVMDEPLKALTLSMAFRSDVVAPTPVFVERLVRSSSSNPGFFRFRAQRNGGDEQERRGTLRFSINGANKKSEMATSTVAWNEQAGSWNHVGMVYEAGKVTFYLNGEVLGDPVELSISEIPGAEGANHYVRAGHGYVGAFDDLMIIPNKALTPDEMRLLVQKGPADAEVQALIH